MDCTETEKTAMFLYSTIQHPHNLLRCPQVPLQGHRSPEEYDHPFSLPEISLTQVLIPEWAFTPNRDSMSTSINAGAFILTCDKVCLHDTLAPLFEQELMVIPFFSH